MDLNFSPNDAVNSLLVVWIIWVSGACGIVTFAANKQRKTNNAAFQKIRDLEKRIKEITHE